MSIAVTATAKGRTVVTVQVESTDFVSAHTDHELALAAGYGTSHFGFHVVRPVDEPHRATVTLYTD